MLRHHSGRRHRELEEASGLLAPHHDRQDRIHHVEEELHVPAFAAVVAACPVPQVVLTVHARTSDHRRTEASS